MTAHIKKLIQQLDDLTGPSYDARAELIGIGSDEGGNGARRPKPP
ncbi:hypothetical protein ACIHCM_29140 [Streptomyces sp. NPDC052023]